MDYIEGLLLGPAWSDTEYAERQHKAQPFALFCVFYCLILLFSGVRTGYSMKSFISFFLFLVLSLISPFISGVYYRKDLLFRVPILLLQGCKFLFLQLSFIFVVRSLIQKLLNTNLRENLIGVSDVFANLFSSISGRLGLWGIIVATFFMGVLATVLLLLSILLFFSLPNWLWRATRFWQNLVDYCLLKILPKEKFQTR